MRLLRTWLVLLSIPFVIVCAHAGDLPFRIPPEGKPEHLGGELKYERPTAMAFDSQNRPYMFNACEPELFGHILTLRDGRWKRLSYLDELKEEHPTLRPPGERDLHAPGTLTIDDSDRLYAIIYAGGQPVLLYSPDLGNSFQVYMLPGRPRKAFLEVRTGNNDLGRPPAIGTLAYRKDYPTRWTAYYDLSVVLPQRTENGLNLGETVHVTDRCFGISNHSGGYSFAVTTGAKTHVTYAEIPEEPESGNPTFVATLDRKSRQVMAREFLVDAHPKKADVHSTPVIAADSEGDLHVLAGAHGGSFKYLRSRAADTITSGWTEPVLLGGRQTYATLICDDEDRLHTVFRIHPRLLYQRKPAGADTWSDKQALVTAPKGHRGYTIFYHRLFIDRRGKPYLSFTFWEQDTGDEGRYPRVVVTSDDGGETWELATTEGFMEGVSAEK